MTAASGGGPCRESGEGRRGLRPPEEYDLVIVGAGPAGLFCAIHSRREGRRILVLEKKGSLGRKLLMTGSGRCNITHDGDIRAFPDHYGGHGRFLRPALLGFTNRDLVSLFEGKGLAMVREEGGRIFPGTSRAGDVLDVLVGECGAGDVRLKCNQEVRSVAGSANGFRWVTGDRVYVSPLGVIATGGLSHPATGSTGDGYRFAGDMGLGVTETGPALTPVHIKDHPFAALAGISLPDREVSLHRGGKRRDHRGDILFTHEGLSGPGILDLSREARVGDTLKVSFARGRKRGEMEAWLLDKTRQAGAGMLRSALAELSLPPRLLARILEILEIPAGLGCAHLTREMRIALAGALTGFPMVVSGLGGFDVAMATRGGVDLKEVDPKTMESRRVRGLYFAGEVLDVDGDSGGYNLQAACSTGVLAARSLRRNWGNS